jgi:predicted transcriptional regulator
LKTAKDVMTKNVITVSSEEKIKDAVQKMEKNGVKELPVMSENKMLGMITYFDLI